MFRRVHLLVLTLFVVLTAAGCGTSAKPVERKYENIIAIAWHERNRFTLWLQNPGTTRTTRVYIDDFGDRVDVFTDIPEGGKSWVRVVSNSNYPTQIWYAEIHIHSLKDLMGADWNHGKFGRGKTTFIDRP